MRILKLWAAVALMLGSFGLAPAAFAQWHDNRPHRVERSDHRADYRRDRIRRDDRRRYERSRRYERPRYDRSRRYDKRRYDNRRYYNRGARRDACRTVWRNGRQWQVCK